MSSAFSEGALCDLVRGPRAVLDLHSELTGSSPQWITWLLVIAHSINGDALFGLSTQPQLIAEYPQNRFVMQIVICTTCVLPIKV